MNILVDGQILRTPEARRGIGVAFLRLLEQLVLSDSATHWQIAVADESDLAVLPPQVAQRITAAVIENPAAQADFATAGAAYSAALQEYCRAAEIDAYWNPDPLMLNVLLPLELRGPRIFVTVYDLIPWVLRATYFDAWPAHVRAEYERRLRALPEWADRLLFISQSARDDYAALDPGVQDKSSVVLLAADHARFAPLRLPPATDGPRYVLFTGGFDPRKNLEGALAGFARLVQQRPDLTRDLQLYIVCATSPEPQARLEARAKQLGVADRLVLTGYVDDDRLAELYQNAQAFFFPSLYEGFGLPVLEALACGVPVVTTRASSLPEVAGEHAEYCAPDDPSDMARALAAALERGREPARRRAAVEHARTFTWQRAAHGYYREFQGLARPKLHRAARPRVAFVSPWPPQRTGIANYSQQLVEHLRKHAELTLFVERPNECTAPRGDLPLRPLSELTAARSEYDCLLYHLGNNSDFHHQTYKQAWEHPGLVVLHDYHLLGFMTHAFRGTREQALYQAALDVAQARNQAFGDPPDDPLCHAIVERSQGAIVHSRWVAEQIAGRTPVYIVPHGAAVRTTAPSLDAATLRKQWSIPADRFVISTLGFIHRFKRVPALLEALRKLLDEGYPAHLVIGGSLVDPSLLIEQRIEDLGLARHVSVTGYLEDDAFQAVVQLSDVIVNLRCPSMGEASGALMHTLSHGKACLVSNYQQYREIPDSVAWKIDVDDGEGPQLVALLAHLLRNADVRRQLGENAREYVRHYASWELAAELYAQAIARTLAGARRPLPALAA